MFFTRKANDSERVNISPFEKVELKETRICKTKSFDAFERVCAGQVKNVHGIQKWK